MSKDSDNTTAADYEDYGPWIFGPTKFSAIFNNHDPEEPRPPTIALPGNVGSKKSHAVANTATDERDSASTESAHR